jgi:hypothetical protein
VKLEDRYIVLKRSDVARLHKIRQFQLGWVLTDLAEVRLDRRAQALEVECVVIEKDWPEYEPTLKLLASRVDNG